MSQLSELQKKAQEVFERSGWTFDVGEWEIDFQVWLNSFVKEAYLAGAKAYEEAVRLDYGDNKNSVYTLCWNCLTWGVNAPNNKKCGDCGSEDSSEYWPDALSAIKEKSKKFWEENV